VEHVYVKLGDLSCIIFDISCGKTNRQTDKHTYTTEHLTNVTDCLGNNRFTATILVNPCQPAHTVKNRRILLNNVLRPMCPS